MNEVSWKTWTAVFLVITMAFLAYDYWTGAHYIGATTRFLWNGFAFIAQSLARTAEASLALLFRKRALRAVTGIFTAIGFVYVSHLILTDEQVRKATSWREWTRQSVRIFVTRVRAFWLGLHFLAKCTFVVCIVAAQMYFLPSMAAVIVLFPVAFLIPVLQSIWRNVSEFIMDTFFGRWYWNKFGRAHRATTTKLKRVPVVREALELRSLARLQYLTAWRMWRHAPCYRKAKSERRYVSLYEPLRLWWFGELNRYVGRSLLGGPKDWPKTTYEPPLLWYDDAAPHVRFARMVLTAGAMCALTFGVRGSARR